jgi:small ligand-binding sensory domain FIST
VAASGFAAGEHAVPELAAIAVKDALAKAGSDYAHSIILFLSGHFARHAQAAVTAASRAASCLQVTGCTVPGLFTEQAWALDQPAAAAMVLCGPISLGAHQTGKPRLSLATLSAAEPAWLATAGNRFGTLSTGNDTQTEGQVWAQGKIVREGRIEAVIHGGDVHVRASRGIRALSMALEVSDSDNFDLFELEGEPALDNLLRELGPGMAGMEPLPLQLVFAVLPEPGLTPDEARNSGRYSLVSIMSVNRDERSITLATPIPQRATIWWAIREPASAELDMSATLDDLAGSMKHPPGFGLMFSCIGRGPYFYQGHDRDTSLTRERFPGLPLLGAYGAGEIAPLGTSSSIISYSTVLTLVTGEHDV